MSSPGRRGADHRGHTDPDRRQHHGIQQIDDLPTQGRQQHALLALVPGRRAQPRAGRLRRCARAVPTGRETGGNCSWSTAANNDDRTLTGSDRRPA